MSSTILFTTDECQALVDIYTKLLNELGAEYTLTFTKEEIEVIAKLGRAARLYIPENDATRTY
jgi:hypothetical protein